MLEWNDKAALQQIEEATAGGLLACAEFFDLTHSSKVSISADPQSVSFKLKKTASGRRAKHTVYGNPSKPGEYPHVRTGAGRRSIWHEPSNTRGVIDAGLKVFCGYRKLAGDTNHMLILERLEGGRARLGLLKTLEDNRDQLAAKATGRA